MYILVETPRRGKTVSLKVEGTDTFDTVNAKIRSMKGVLPEDSCHLEYTYSTNDDSDPNNQPLEPGDFKLSVRRLTTGDTFTFLVHKDLSIRDLQWMLFQEEHFPPFCQTLFFTGIKLDNKKRTLTSYNISGGSTVDLFIGHGGMLKLPIQTLSGNTISLDDVFRNNKISKIKAMIQDKEGIDSRKQKLAYAGELLDDSLSLASYCVQKGSTFLLLLVDDDDTLITKERELLIYIFIEATKKTIDLKVKSSATVHDVKAMIQDVADIPAHQQILFLPKKQLEDGLTLDQYYLPNNSTLHLVQTVEFQEGKDPGEGDLVGPIPCSNLKRKCPEPVGRPI